MIPTPLSNLRAKLVERTTTAYPMASAIALCGLSALDGLDDAEPRNAVAWLPMLAMALALGTLHGLAWSAVVRVLSRLPRWIAFTVWCCASLAAATWLASELGGFSRLHGRYAELAIWVLATCGLGAVLASALFCSMQPTRGVSEGILPALGARTRASASCVLLAAAIGFFYADRHFYADLYFIAHAALRWLSLWLAALSFVLLERDAAWLRPARAVMLAFVLTSAWPLARLDDRDYPVLEGLNAHTWSSALLSATRGLTDFDRDGYSSLLGGGDCAPFDPRVSPAAREVPDNGIDDNCILGDAKRSIERAEALAAVTEPSPVDVVLITIDALRPDHLGVYDAQYGKRARNTSPAIDRFAAHATVFRDAYTPGGWTSIAVPALMRGVYPRRMQWTRYYETNYHAMLRQPLLLRAGELAERIFPLSYADPHPTLAQRLSRRGMFTAAVVDDGYSELMRRGLGLEDGFSVFRTVDSLPKTLRNDAGTVNTALSTLRQLPAGRRSFMWVHLFGPHGPDELHAGVKVYGNTPADRYDHEIAFLDQELARLLTALEQRKEPTAIFVTADHGEAFFRNIRYHGQTLDQDIVRIPLIARVPGWRHGDVHGLVSLLDLAPTILALTHTPTSAAFDGMALTPPANGTALAKRILLSDTWRYEADGRPALELVAAYDGDHKVVLDRLRQFFAAYDLRPVVPLSISASGPSIDPLKRAVFGYLDETGGELRVGN